VLVRNADRFKRSSLALIVATESACGNDAGQVSDVRDVIDFGWHGLA
jgi:hypothetical protein